MKMLKEKLKELGVEFKDQAYGNPTYFGDFFSKQGVLFFIPFSERSKKNLIETYIKRRKTIVISSSFINGCGIVYNVLTTKDSKELEEHGKRINDSVKKFWGEKGA